MVTHSRTGKSNWSTLVILRDREGSERQNPRRNGRGQKQPDLARFIGARSAAGSDTAVTSRSLLQETGSITGPAIVQQTDATVVVPPDVTATALPDGCLLLSSTGNET